MTDLLADMTITLTPENVRQSYSRNPYNAAVEALNALHDQRETIWEERIRDYNGGELTPGAPYPGGTVAQMQVLAAEIAGAEELVRTYEARINAIEAMRAIPVTVESGGRSQVAPSEPLPTPRVPPVDRHPPPLEPTRPAAKPTIPRWVIYTAMGIVGLIILALIF
jgi:hypothetical protein